jgi:membrane protein DedA with SNARE-associated domain
VFDFFLDLVTSSPITYAFVAGLVAMDAVFPLVPGETVCITAGVLVANGDLWLPLVVVAAAVGGFIGDNASYALGATLGRPAARSMFRRDRSRRLLEWIRKQLSVRPAVIILTARFLPGGRTAATFASGTVEVSWRRFVLSDLLAVTVWAAYAVMLGYVGGEAFSESLWQPLVIAAAVAAAVAGIGEVVRRRATA